uniref:HTH_48 domain-containing protein n=1 Tax=Globodera pallida TaxID=36090 RepID=A0A183C988_GLOPA
MAEDKENAHTLLHIQFQNGERAAKAARNVNAVLGADVISVKAAQKWFRQFREGRNSTKRRVGSGRPSTVNKRVLALRLRHKPDSSSAELARGHCHQTTSWRWLRKTGRRPRRTKWVPHRLTEEQKRRRLDLSLSNIARHRRGHVLSRLVTCDESYICYDGTVQKIVWRQPGEDPILVPRPPPHQKKLMLCIFWSVHGPLYWELLPRNTILDSNLYINQLRAVDLAYRIRRRQGQFNGPLLFHQDNAPPHRSRLTTQYISQTLNWNVLPHPPYSPDLAPSDYHLFLSLKNFLRGRRFTEDAQVEEAVGQYLTSKIGTDFFRRGIKNFLPVGEML